jgi:hypothetical protein
MGASRTFGLTHAINLQPGRARVKSNQANPGIKSDDSAFFFQEGRPAGQAGMPGVLSVVRSPAQEIQNA